MTMFATRPPAKGYFSGEEHLVLERDGHIDRIGHALAPRVLHWCVLILLLCTSTVSWAQSASNLRARWVVFGGDTLTLDTLSIVPGSLQFVLDSAVVDPSHYTLDPFLARVVWKHAPDSAWATYRTMPLLLGATVAHKDPQKLTTEGTRDDPFRYVPPRGSDDIMGIHGLSRSGSISRGLLFGNKQDLSVNSTLNLELGGHITDRISVLASVTDNNIPVQAGGNTAELKDFDQVFIKLFEEDDKAPGNKWELIAGDFVLQKPTSHFLTYLKKTKGLSYDTRFNLGGGRMTMGASAAISKGKFARNVIQGVEGVQGPYRLKGNDAGSVIIILSGSERVYIDGQLLQRGQENDYVIDYNSAEVVFTARRLITKDRRIVVEFQYSDKNYARSLLRFDDTYERGKSTVRLHVYSEQDHRNQPLQQQVGDAERTVLQSAGDDPLAASINGIDSTGFAADQVLYALIDSLGYDSVAVHGTDPSTDFYRITFTDVGQGNGDYVLQEFTPNGRVFSWSPPDTLNGVIVHTGTYAPIRLIIAPKAQQLITVGVDHRFAPRTTATVEAAFSNNDLNTFSTLDQSDNAGFGLMTRFAHAMRISERDTSLHLLLGGEAESISKDFKFVERYRAVEFERNWNALKADLKADQILGGAFVGVQARKLGRFTYGVNTFQAKDKYDGVKQDINSNLHVGRIDLVGVASWLKEREPRISDFLRHKGSFRYRLKPFTIGLRDEHERNLYKVDSTTALQTGSYEFHDWEMFVQSPDTFKNKWRLSGGQRRDRALREGGLTTSTLATAYAFNMELTRNPRNKLTTNFTYRELSIIDSTLTQQRPENTYLTRIDYDLTLWKGVAVLDMFNEFGSGLEQRREYIYVLVPAGQGLYIWNDYNGDGIKDLNEFELANFSYEANYLRVFVPSNNYVRTFNNQSSASLDLRPGVKWATAKGMKRFIGKFSDLASARVDRKTNTTDINKAINPFAPETIDKNLMAYTSSARNTFFYDRTSRSWSMDHTWQNDRSRSLLLNGFESRQRLFNTVRVRWNTTRQWTAELEGERGRVSNASDLLAGRTWAIDQQSLKPKLTWQPNTSLRAIMSFKYGEKKSNSEGQTQNLGVKDLGFEFRYNTAGKGSVLVTANLVDIRYDGPVNSALGNELLGGLKPGTNGTWSVSVQRNLSNNLQLDLTYNGRRSEGVPVVHVGGAQVRAFF
ncbi:MAG TPA: hypothetical protein PK760_00970 [Flavobacteriales bacterium]|nr:hypothetical protein [Flavobacteriales bacterium]